MPFSSRSLLDPLFVSVAVLMQWKLLAWALESPLLKTTRKLRHLLPLAFWASAALQLVCVVYGLLSYNRIIPLFDGLDWLRGACVAWCIAWSGVFAVAFLLRRAPEFDPRRRKVLGAGSGLLLAAPLAATAGGVIAGRTSFRIDKREIGFPGLSPDLDGLRIVHLSDIHLGPFLDPADLERIVGMANETRPHLAAVTGDFITVRDDWLSDCLRILSRLRAEAGVYACLGNHEMRARCSDRAKAEGASHGIEVLRGEARGVRFGQAALNVAGVDYQRMKRPYLVGSGELVKPGEFNLMLSHNPDVFPAAAAQGWDFTLAGHTHGGQVTAGILSQYLNVARVFTPYVYGTYRNGRSAIYVTRGIGTVGVPARIGAPPEIGLIRLCAI
jgi:predicted MPP superfamily phosphohydrolase